MPSKFYGTAAVGRPIISVSSPEGETAGLVRRHACGLVVEPGDGTSLAEALMLLSKDPQAAADMGKRARAMLDDGLTRRHAFVRWESLLTTVMTART